MGAGEREGLTTGEREELSKLYKAGGFCIRKKRSSEKATRSFSSGRTAGSGECLPGTTTRSDRIVGFLRVDEPVLEVLRSGYDEGKVRAPLKRNRENVALATEIREVHDTSRRTYGHLRVHAELTEFSGSALLQQARRPALMRKAGIQGCPRGRRKRTASPDEYALTAADLMKRNFHAIAPDKLWTADITYVGS